jgi:hypothetical protein
VLNSELNSAPGNSHHLVFSLSNGDLSAVFYVARNKRKL